MMNVTSRNRQSLFIPLIPSLLPHSQSLSMCKSKRQKPKEVSCNEPITQLKVAYSSLIHELHLDRAQCQPHFRLTMGQFDWPDHHSNIKLCFFKS